MSTFLYVYYTLVKSFFRVSYGLRLPNFTFTSCMIFSRLILEFHADKLGIKAVSTSDNYRRD